MNIICERIRLKRDVCAAIAFFVYMLLDYYDQDSYMMKYSIPFIVLFMTMSGFSYLKIFNETVTINRDDRYITITKEKKQKKYAHEQQDEISLISASVLANYDELIISIPKKKIRFVLSVYEKDINNKLEIWNAERQ